MIAAGIVLFNPDIERLRENISAIKPQVECIVCVDNGSSNFDEINKLLNEFEISNLIKNNENKGIAAALNRLCLFAEDNGYDWILTLDQDSVCPSNLIQEYEKNLNIEKLGMLTPLVKDRNFDFDSTKELLPYEEVNRCITSACLTNISAWREVGGFDEELFIDYVDYDLCAKFKLRGYKIVKVNSTVLLHEIGNGTYFNFLGKKYTASNHSVFRKYYIFRNATYYHKMYKDRLGSHEIRNLLKLFIKVLLAEKNKFEKIKVMIKGYRDGIKLYKKRVKNTERE